MTSRAPTEASSGAPLEIALVNNMPESAAEATVAQFETLLRRSAQGIAYRLRCYALPQSDVARCSIFETHEGIEALYARGADVLIVTGAEPRAEKLSQEPFWEDFSQLVSWARSETSGTLWSCLAAHAAVEVLDGVQRRRQKQKVSGIYACNTTPGDWAAQGAAADEILVPHSRYNALDRDDLVQNGYSISSWSPAIGVDSFWRREPSLFLFTQGHPEYSENTLASEFRRDLLRFIKGTSASSPQMPENYFSDSAREEIARLEANPGEQDPSGFVEKLDTILKQSPPEARWFDDSERLYNNWLRMIAAERKQRLSR
jgi:homoserine O-succinyltransferase/O-acetyltransferase